MRSGSCGPAVIVIEAVSDLELCYHLVAGFHGVLEESGDGVVDLGAAPLCVSLGVVHDGVRLSRVCVHRRAEAELEAYHGAEVLRGKGDVGGKGHWRFQAVAPLSASERMVALNALISCSRVVLNLASYIVCVSFPWRFWEGAVRMLAASGSASSSSVE